MSLTQSARTGWQEFLHALTPDDRQKLMTWLRDEYQEEAQNIVQFTQQAKRMYYPLFRERLWRIAAAQQIHVQWLREQILALGGQPPVTVHPTELEQNSWHDLLLDLDEEEHLVADLGCVDQSVDDR